MTKHLGWMTARIAFGLAIASHGYLKIFGITPDGGPVMTKFVGAVAGLGFPEPVFFAWAAAVSEFGGGILLALGFLGRIPAFFLTVTMAVALYRHRVQSFSEMELAFLYFSVFLSYLLAGPGKYSLDRLIFFRIRID